MNDATKNFMGTGWKFPIEFKKTLGTVVMLSGEDDIRNSLEVLFATRVGERIMHASYGSALDSFLFMPINRSTITYMKAIISDEILFNEPRIILNDIEINRSPTEDGKLDIIFDYSISQTNNRYNFVYPFYISEATNLKK
jgi:hypothetical protein